MPSMEDSPLREANLPLLEHHSLTDERDEQDQKLLPRFWIESKKLWHIVGPSIFSRVASYSMLVITQAFAGRLGDLELAAISIAHNVVIGFDFGLLLGMASALETLCGQAFGAKKYYMLGVYLQRSWIVLFICCILLLPLYLFASPVLKLLGQPHDLADLTGTVSMWLIPVHFAFAFQFPLQRFLQCQVKTAPIAWVSLVALLVHVFVSWLFVFKLEFGVIGAAATINISWWVLTLGLFGYSVWGGCPQTWAGFSVEAFSGLWEFVKLSAASGVMLCLESWYYKILIVMTWNLENAEIAVDALSICMSINSLELMIPFAFFAATGVRVANELGGGNGKGAKFATTVSVVTSVIIGLFFSILILILHDKIGYIFSNSKPVLDQVNNLSLLLVFTILLNSVQPILSGVAVGSGWQSYVAYINLGCYYIIGLPLGILMGWVFKLGVMGIWAGMIFGGTATQTLILSIITIRCDWEKEAESAKLRMTKWTDSKHELN
ncbi:protein DETOXIFICATION 27-like [Vigna radiata var. radiata]|uniref:Protein DETOXIFICATION n=1 Tax=Vigna radiata var. radiata TaxID=3916 RepID=A0A1S3VSK2_VIGRR|nr:protein DETOXIFICATION 27-like [Vigna radiata var. radiata]